MDADFKEKRRLVLASFESLKNILGDVISRVEFANPKRGRWQKVSRHCSNILYLPSS